MEHKYFVEFNEEKLGTLYVDFVNGKEIHSFEFDNSYLANNDKNKFFDPDLLLIPGRQYLPEGKTVFSFLSDSMPDRWGRKLIGRYLKNKGIDRINNIDYLIGISDIYRMGSIRIKDIKGNYLSSNNVSVPPWIFLNKLEYASLKFDDEQDVNDEEMKMLLSPGSSLGGARPKANVFDNSGDIWIAKFPSKNDDIDVGAWEMATRDLMEICNINVPISKCEKFSKYGSTFLTKRFDRNKEKRIQFFSAMNLLGAIDGSDDYSYIDLANFIVEHGARVNEDLLELYRRIIFNVIVNNTDDHLRNHGFLYQDNGYILSPAFDVNISLYSRQHALKITDTSDIGNIENLKSIALYFRVTDEKADKLIEEIRDKIKSNLVSIANKYHISTKEIELVKKSLL